MAARNTGRISKRTVDAARCVDGKRSILWDDKLAGFGLLVLPSGVKSYVYDYRNAHGTKRRLTIGKVGTITPDKARELAEGHAAAVKEGGDPLTARREMREAATVGDVLDAYLVSAKFNAKAPGTQAIDRGRIQRHLRPTLGRKHVDALTAEDVRKAFVSIRDGKTAARVKTKARGLARVTGGEGTARMAVRLLRAVLSWAVTDGRARRNVAAGVDVGSDGARDVILNADEYGRLFRTIETLERQRELRSPVADAIRVIALTGARRGEIAGLRWRHVDLRNGRIVLPLAEHKTGRRTGKAKMIALPAAAQEIIARQAAGEPDTRVFRAVKGEGDVNLSQPWRRIRKVAELPTGIGLHGLRHSVASHLAMGGAQAAEIMAALGHRQLSTAQRYVHFADAARSTLAEKAAAPALAALANAAGQAPAEVVDLRPKRRNR